MRRLVDYVGLGRLETERPSIPENLAVFAIGDVHGRVDLLVKMHQEILRRASDLPPTMKKIVVYLGDYVDYGPESADVIDLLVSCPLPGFQSVYLLGNHELAFISYLKGEMDFLRWTKTHRENSELPQKYLISQQLAKWMYQDGGIETLKSYGVTLIKNPGPEAIAAMRIELLRKMPTDHFQFLENLRLSYSVGDFFFVHAGVDPSRPLREQKPSDMLGIDDRFLESTAILDKIIVHGHTPYPTPCIRPNRIGLDTQAHASGKLSALMITKDRYTVIQSCVD